MKNFYIRSIELRDYKEKHNCRVIRFVDDNKILIDLSPSMPGYIYGFKDDVDQLVIAPRCEGSALVPEVSEWPCVVNICVPSDGGNWDIGPWMLLDVGEITQS